MIERLPGKHCVKGDIMKPISISEIEKAVSGKLMQGNGNKKVTSVSIDTRTLEKGDIFIALKGENYDAHNFVEEAVKKGASALIVEKNNINFDSVPIIVVEDTLKALQDFAHYYRMTFSDLKVIGITGSAGKTTTKDMVEGVLKSKYKVLKTKKNLNNHIGVPLTLLELEGDEDFAVIEMGMSSIGEIRKLSRIARPQIGIITNVGPSHLEELGDVETVAQGKSELIEELPGSGTAVLNYDNNYVRKMKKNFQGENIIYYGFNENADVYVKDINEGVEGNRYTINYRGEEVVLYITRPGKHNIYNALSAVIAGRENGIEWSSIQSGINNADYSELRMDIKKANNFRIIDDTYNANPLSVKAGINVLTVISNNRSIAVLGDMLELGDYREQAHRNVGKYVASKGVDFLICCGELARYFASGAKEAGMEKKSIFKVLSNSEAIEVLENLINPGDTLLIKGSRGMEMEEIVDALTEQGG